MEVVALDSSARIIQVVFAQMFDIDVSMITVIVRARQRRQVPFLIAFSATGSGLPVSTISGNLTQMTGPLNQEFVNKDLSCMVSSVSANVAEDFPVTLELGPVKAEGSVSSGFLHHPFDQEANQLLWPGSSPASCTDSSTPTCSGSVCIAMPC